MNRDYEQHYKELSDKLNRNREEDMQTLSEWYLNSKSLDLTTEEHLEIMELLGFERQESSDEFNLEEADYVTEVSVKFNSWFKKRWEFLNEYYKIMQSASNSFIDAASMLKDMEWNSELEIKAEGSQAMIQLYGREALQKYLDITLEECDDYIPSQNAVVLTEEQFSTWSKDAGVDFGSRIEVKDNIVYIVCSLGGRHCIGHKTKVTQTTICINQGEEL